LEKYLFLYLKTGGGHLAPAKAVAEKIFSKKKKAVDIELLDGLKESNILIKKFVEDGYKTAVNKAAWTFEFLYAIHKIQIISRLSALIISIAVKPGLKRHIIETSPSKIVIFHFFLIKPVYEILESLGLDTPVLTVVTDPFTAHPMWFLKKEQTYIIFSELLKDKCIEKGIDKDNLHVFPFVLDKKFSQKVSDNRKIKIRQELGFKTDSKIILIIGGGEGMPKGKKILKKLIEKNLEAEIAIVCGKNMELHKKAVKLITKRGLTNVKVYGFVEFVHSLLSISDIVITKCGASTSMEILLMGKIPVINNYIWEQEKGNMEFVCNNNLGIFEKNTNTLPDVLQRLLTDLDFYNSFRTNIQNEGMQNGVGRVSDYILNYQ
jgi:UDP-N-acetylglucosamine:LPS N-acetylglucosamine transferase